MRRITLLSIIFALFLLPCLAQTKMPANLGKKNASTKNQISEAQRKEFIELLKKLPTKGEFYTEQSEQKAAPYLPILFALTEKDLEEYDFYPFGAISRGIYDQKKYRHYAVTHFDEIQHPKLKLFWATMLFNEKKESAEIAKFLREVLAIEERAKILSDMLGPNFEDFKQRVNSYPKNK